MCRVANHKNFFAFQIASEFFIRAFVRDPSDAITLLMIIRERSSFKMLPQVIATKFQLRAQPNISGQQTEDRLVRRMQQAIQKMFDSFARSAIKMMQKVIEPIRIPIEEPREVARRFFQFVFTKDLAHQRNIRAPVKNYMFGRFGKIEFSGESFAKCLYAGATCTNERSVDIKQHKANHGAITREVPGARQDG
jgi:hypothetical protein